MPEPSSPPCRPRDLLRPPDLAEVLPLLRAGVLLSTRMMLAMGTFVYATRAIAGFGAAAVAGHEILRTLWVTATQAFSSLDIATQVGCTGFVTRGGPGMGPRCEGWSQGQLLRSTPSLRR